MGRLGWGDAMRMFSVNSYRGPLWVVLDSLVSSGSHQPWITIQRIYIQSSHKIEVWNRCLEACLHTWGIKIEKIFGLLIVASTSEASCSLLTPSLHGRVWVGSLSWSVSISGESEPGQVQQPSQHTANSGKSGTQSHISVLVRKKNDPQWFNTMQVCFLP